MGTKGKTFSESWHRVAGLKMGLRPTVRSHKQYFRGEQWIVLNDSFNNQFFRFRPEAYAFIARLSPWQTVEEVWQQCLTLFPDTVPGQEDVIKLLSQLYFANLLYFTSRPDSVKIFERHDKRKKREFRSKLTSVMFLRLPLFDPDRFLLRAMPVFKAVISPLGAIIWLAVIVLAGKLLVDNWNTAFDQAQGVLVPGNIALLYTALVIIKILHEFGHAATCRRFGAEVHTMGIMLLVFSPLPYMDATSSWALRDRWHRILVAAAGVMVEMFLAALAVFVWVKTGTGILHSLAYNVMFIASISTIIFNANPLLRFDGYYILSDFLDIPNLHTQSRAHLRYLAEKYAFGCETVYSPAQSARESVLLTIFGIASFVYKLIIFTVIILFVTDVFFLGGIIIAFVYIMSMLVIPSFGFVAYLTSNSRLVGKRLRASGLSFALAAIVLILIFKCPLPSSFRASGVVESKELYKIFIQDSGYVSDLPTDSGSVVSKGETLAVLRSRELELDLISTHAQLRESQAMIIQARHESVVDLMVLEQRLTTVKARIIDLENRLRALTVTAGKNGIWYAPNIKELSGRAVKQGTHLGDLLDLEQIQFTAVVTQDEASRLFQDQIRHVNVRIKGNAHKAVEVDEFQIIPFEQKELPSAALGWHGGGKIATSFEDDSGIMTQESFFIIKALLKRKNGVLLLPGQSGIIRLGLPARPLYYQLFRKLRQMVQKRYRI